MRKRIIGLALLPALFVLIAQAFWAHDPMQVELGDALAAPSLAHPFGCDALGRDLLARLAEGLRLSLAAGAIVAALGLLVGASIGMLAGWFGGWIDAVLMRFVDLVLAFPGMLLAIALAAMLGAGADKAITALALVGWTGFARLARTQTQRLRAAPFVSAAVAAGAGWARIAWHHLLPNIAAVLAVEASFSFAAAILGEAGLSFLGLGAQPPAASLGSLIREGTRFMLDAPWLVVFPGVVLFGLVLAANLAGDALRDLLDVRAQKEA